MPKFQPNAQPPHCAEVVVGVPSIDTPNVPMVWPPPVSRTSILLSADHHEQPLAGAP